jgi:hypothetical protein
MTKKTWLEKLHQNKEPQIKRMDKSFADIPKDSLMLIANPKIISDYIKKIPFGKQLQFKTLRNDLALQYQADFTCLVTTGIFLRIIAEANYEKLNQGFTIHNVTPFWRAIDPKSTLAKKLSFGSDFLIEQIENEKS